MDESAVGPSVVGTVASTPIRLALAAACVAIASSILTIGTSTALRAASRVGPSEEHAEKITSAPARSAASASSTIRFSLSAEDPALPDYRGQHVRVEQNG